MERNIFQMISASSIKQRNKTKTERVGATQKWRVATLSCVRLPDSHLGQWRACPQACPGASLRAFRTCPHLRVSRQSASPASSLNFGHSALVCPESSRGPDPWPLSVLAHALSGLRIPRGQAEQSWLLHSHDIGSKAAPACSL